MGETAAGTHSRRRAGAACRVRPIIVRRMGISASRRDAAMPRVLALVSSRAAGPRRIVALLAANGFPVSTATAPERMDGAAADVVMACAATGRDAVALARAVRERVALPLVMVLART